MSMLYTVTADVTTVNAGAGVKLDTSPFMGGQGRKAILRVPVLPLTSEVELQGHGPTADGSDPGAASTGWATITNTDVTSASGTVIEEIELPLWIRYSTTVLDADGPDVVFYLEGVQ